MKKIKFGYQGLSGAYHERAAKSYLSSRHKSSKGIEFVSCNTFEEIFENVENGKFTYGVVAVENSLMGSIYKNFDLLEKHNLKIVGEVYIHVRHQLYVLPGMKKNDIKEIMSQSPSLLQCEHNIKRNFPKCKITEYFDSVASSKFIADNKILAKERGLACISPEGVGEKYGLKNLMKDFNDDMDNYTRFFIIQKKFAKLPSGINEKQYKTSILFYGGNVSGFLYKALGCFSLRDIDLSKIESRPIAKSPWNYYFYLDFNGKYDDFKVTNALNNLREYAKEVKVLGSYYADKI